MEEIHVKPRVRYSALALGNRKDYGHEPHNTEVLWIRFGLLQRHRNGLTADDFLPFTLTRREGDSEYYYPFARRIEIIGSDLVVSFLESIREKHRNVILPPGVYVVHIDHVAIRYQRETRLAKGESARTLRS